MRALAALLLLTACSAEREPAQQVAQAEPTRFELTTPLFNAAVALPQDAIGAGDFDMNGVPLPPGSSVRGMTVRADAEPSQPTLTLRFANPRPPGAVRDWLLPRLGEVGYTLTPTAQGLQGTTEDGKPFRLALAADGSGSTGTIELVD